MRKKVCFLLVTISILMLAGCGKEKIIYEDTYIQGQDFPYQYSGCTYEFGVSTVETEDGYYKLMNKFLYYIDKKTMKTTPLCGKTDCLHDKEKGKHLEECNAFVNSEDGYIYQYGDYMYFLSLEYNKTENAYENNLYRISMDASNREKVCKLKEKKISLWMIHRGYVYYVTDKDKHNALMRFSLDDSTHKAETVTVLKNVYNADPSELIAYGNYVYFYTLGFNKDIKNDLSDNWTKTMANCWVCYNIKTGEVKELFPEQVRNGETVKIVQNIRFFKDKIITEYSYMDKKNEDGKSVYQFDLNGENKKKILELEDAMDCICADENYLYVYNSWRDSVADGKEKPQMLVYDKDLKKIDNMEMPISAYTHLSPGNKDCFLMGQEGEDTSAIVYIKKDKIGTYHGKKMEAAACYETQNNTDDTETAE